MYNIDDWSTPHAIKLFRWSSPVSKRGNAADTGCAAEVSVKFSRSATTRNGAAKDGNKANSRTTDGAVTVSIKHSHITANSTAPSGAKLGGSTKVARRAADEGDAQLSDGTTAGSVVAAGVKVCSGSAATTHSSSNGFLS